MHLQFKYRICKTVSTCLLGPDQENFTVNNKRNLKTYGKTRKLEDVTNKPVAGNLDVTICSLSYNEPVGETIVLPTHKWSELSTGLRPAYKIIYAETNFREDIPYFTKSVAVNFIESTATNYIFGVKCQKDNYCNPIRFYAAGDVSKILKEFEAEQVCTGITNPKYHNFGDFEGVSFSKYAWRSNE